MGEADAGDVLQDLDHVLEAGAGAAGQVDLGDVAGDHRGGAEADPGEEHLHLLDGGVLALVEDDEAVVQRAPAHVGQRRDLDDVALDQLGHVFEAEHLVERVVERAQVGVDLLRQVAGKETELLAGLDRRAHQQDAADLLALQGVDGAGHGEVGLAGASRTDAEVDVVVEDRLDVALLVGAARADVRLARLQGDLRRALQFLEVFQAGLLQVQVHGVGSEIGAVLRLAVETLQQAFGDLGPARFAGQFELVAAVADLDVEAFLDLVEMLVELPAKCREAAGVERLEDKAMKFLGAFKVFCRTRQWLIDREENNRWISSRKVAVSRRRFPGSR